MAKIDDPAQARRDRQQLITDMLATAAADAAAGTEESGEQKKPSAKKAGKGAEAGGKGAHGPLGIGGASKGLVGAPSAFDAVGAGRPESKLTSSPQDKDPLGTSPEMEAAQGATGEHALDDISALAAGHDDEMAAQKLNHAATALVEQAQNPASSDAALKKALKHFAAEMKDNGLGDRVPSAVRDLVDTKALGSKQLARVFAVAKEAGVAVDTSDKQPDVKTAEQQLQASLTAEPSNVAQITLKTAQLTRALRSDGKDATAIESRISSAISASGASGGASAAAIVAAVMLGYPMIGSSKDAASEAKAVAASNALKRAAAKAQAAAPPAAPAEAPSPAYTNKSSEYYKAPQNAGGGGTGGGGGAKASGGGSSGTGATNNGSSPSVASTGGTNTAVKSTAGGAGSISAPAGAVGGEGIQGFGKQIPWTEFSQKSYGSPTKFNNETQTYTTDGSNISYDADKNMVITARPEGASVRGGQQGWTSARLEGPTFGKVPTYIEAVIKTPAGQGTWPAFWSTGPNWPTTAEIDTMEQVNGGGHNISTHWGENADNATFNTHQKVDLPDMSKTFHRYGVYADKEGVQFYLDGKPVGDKVKMPGDWVNNAKSQQMVVNLAMGGDWPGAAPASTGAQEMKIKGIYQSDTPPTS